MGVTLTSLSFSPLIHTRFTCKLRNHRVLIIMIQDGTINTLSTDSGSIREVEVEGEGNFFLRVSCCPTIRIEMEYKSDLTETQMRSTNHNMRFRSFFAVQLNAETIEC